MISVIGSLLDGDQNVVAEFAKAKTFWDQFYASHRNDNETTLAKLLDNTQAQFEHLLNHQRAFAKEIMPVSAIGALYDSVDGLGDNRDLAQRMLNAFAKSYVSIEVKGSRLSEVAQLYNLDDPNKKK